MRLFFKLISLTFLANFIIFSSHAEISLSGYQEFLQDQLINLDKLH